jgi:hypothetical protein
MTGFLGATSPLILVLALVASVPQAADAESPVLPAVFTALQGEWVGEGRLLGRPAEFSMRWESSAPGFVHLAFANTWVAEDGTRTPVLSAAAVYYPRGDQATGVWLDNRPQQITLNATLTDSTVTTTWTAESEQGRTKYRILSADSIEVRDFVIVEGTERPFGEAHYRRAPDPGSR